VPRVEVLRVLVHRLDEEGMSRKCLGLLRQIVADRSNLDHDDEDNPYRLKPDEVGACKTAWQQFLKEREGELADGQTFRFDDQRVPIRALFPGVMFRRDARLERKGK
jgi:hypothetical protein